MKKDYWMVQLKEGADPYEEADKRGPCFLTPDNRLYSEVAVMGIGAGEPDSQCYTFPAEEAFALRDLQTSVEMIDSDAGASLLMELAESLYKQIERVRAVFSKKPPTTEEPVKP